MISSVRRAAWLALLPTALAALPAQAQTLERFAHDKTIRLAVRDDAPPFSYKGPDGVPGGFVVDLCNTVVAHLANDLKLPDLKIENVTVTAANRFETIASGKADLLCEPTTETLSRRDEVDFSIPTFVDGASLLVKSDGQPMDFAALAGKSIGVLAGTTTEALLRDALKKANLDATVVAAPSHADGVKALESGATSAYFADRAILIWLASQSANNAQLQVAQQFFSLEPYALALKRGDSDFRLAVDRALSQIYRSGEIIGIWQATFGTAFQPTDTLKTLYMTSALPD